MQESSGTKEKRIKRMECMERLTERAMPMCIDTRPCFGRVTIGKKRRCAVLIETYRADRKCPFCKTKGEESK